MISAIGKSIMAVMNLYVYNHAVVILVGYRKSGRSSIAESFGHGGYAILFKEHFPKWIEQVRLATISDFR